MIDKLEIELESVDVDVDTGEFVYVIKTAVGQFEERQKIEEALDIELEDGQQADIKVENQTLIVSGAEGRVEMPLQELKSVVEND